MRHSFACFTLALTFCCAGAAGRPRRRHRVTHRHPRRTLIDGISETRGRTSSFGEASTSERGRKPARQGE